MKAKKILCSALAATVAAGAISVCAFAEDEKEMSVTLRIEGIKENLYYDTVDVPYNSENLTVQNALMYIDEQSDDINITGVDSGWITAVNDDVQGTFGGWDGWLYTVNGVSPSDTVDTYKLSDGDSIVLYYGDPYGVGMQYPVADESKIDEGILTFTSEDTAYDADWNPTVVTNPVSNATVTWSYDGGSVDYITDENGSIKIDNKFLNAGNHTVAISKLSDNGIPLVLRFAPDYSVTVASSQITDNSSSEPKSENPVSTPESKPESSEPTSTPESSSVAPADTSVSTTDGKAPSTGDSANTVAVVALLTSAVFAFAIVLGKKKNEE